MAKSILLLDKLECSICHEKFTTPKTLPCLHSFCSQCLNQYILSKGGHRELGGFHCPVCREFTHVPDPTQTLNTWWKQFRTNFHLHDLVETESRAIADQAFCQHHLAKALDLYCTNCQCALCSVCVFTEHIGCGKIESIDNVVCGKRSKLELLANRLKMSIDDSQTERKIVEKYVKDLESNKRGVTAEVKDWERKVMISIVKETKSILAQIDDSIKEELTDVSDWISTTDSRIKNTTALVEEMHNVLKKSTMCPVDLLSSSLDLEMRSLEMLEKPECAVRSRSSLTFTKAEWSEGSCSVGHVVMTKMSTDAQSSHTGGRREKSYSILGETVSLVKEVNCFSEHDKKEPCLLDLIVLADEHTLVVTDGANKCIKSYSFVEDGAITCRLPMLNPRCLAVVADDTFVLTTESRNIYFFKVSRVMTMDSRIQIGFWYEKKACYGIASLPEKCLAVSFTDHPGIEIVTYNGTTLRSMSLPQEHLSCALSAGNGLFAASCFSTGTLFMIDYEGDVILEERRNPFTCRPAGVVCDGNLVLYADSKAVSVNEVIGHLIRPLLTERNGLKCPRGLFLSGTEKLFIADRYTVKLFHYKNLTSFKYGKGRDS